MDYLFQSMNNLNFVNMCGKSMNKSKINLEEKCFESVSKPS